MQRLSSVGSMLQDRCAKFILQLEQLDDPAAIEDAVLDHLPRDEPMRSQAIDALAQMLHVDTNACGEEGDIMGALVQAATFRVVVCEQNSGRRSRTSSGRRISEDDTLDLIKVVIVGDSNVGKSCLMRRFTDDQFVSSTRATIGMDFATRVLPVDALQAGESSVVQHLTVQVWDTAGQEQFQSLAASYYRKAGGVIIVYDAQNRASFESLPKWLLQVHENTEGIVTMIIAAKSAEGGTDAVSGEEGSAFAQKNDCLFARTSAKLGEGVLSAFTSLAARVLEEQERKEEESEGMRLQVRLNAPVPALASKKKSRCCS